MKKEDLKTIPKDILIEIIGSLFIAIGVYNFGVQAELPLAGFNGIAIIIYRLTGFPIGTMVLLLNIPVVIICGKILGIRFLIKSFRCMIINSLMIDFAAPLLPLYQGERWLATISTGILTGVGYAMIYMQGSSTGGSDFITLSIRKLKPHLSLGTIVFAFEAVIVAAAGLIFDDMDGVILGLVCNYMNALVVDKAMYGRNSAKTTMIVTEHAQEIARVIDQSTGRGCTFLKARGGYSGADKDVVMCACNNKQMYALQKEIAKIDPMSFMITLESNEVQGEGFKEIEKK